MQNTGKKKSHVGKTLNRAGATRLFGLSAAQKVLGVAPTRHRRTMTMFCPRACRVVSRPTVQSQ